MDANKRPKMGQIVHMLEADEFSYRAVSFTPTVFFYYEMVVNDACLAFAFLLISKICRA